MTLVRPTLPGDLLGAAEARVASWRAAFTGLVPRDTRARGSYARYGFSETADRTCSSLGDLPELRLSVAL